jgi:hypothetical protein
LEPRRTRVPYSDAGPFISGAGAKLCWHTTEGVSLPSYSGSAPHFTFNPKTGKLWQHVPLNRASKSLEHPTGTVETNHANVIQVELIGYAGASTEGKYPSYEVRNWTTADYARIAKLARWIEANAGVKRQSSVRFGAYPNDLPARLSPVEWLRYEGHLGHQHVPNNHHGDPGAFKIALVIGIVAAPSAVRKRAAWSQRLGRVRAAARRHGWTKSRRVLARKLKALIARPT